MPALKATLVTRPSALARLMQAAQASAWLAINGHITCLLAELGGGEREGGKITGGGDYRYA